jgi:hypothetical protein
MDDQQFLERLCAITNEEDRRRAFSQLCRLYGSEATAEQRDFIRGQWDFGCRWHIPRDDTLTIAAADPVPARGRVREALLYHSIENARVDYRDNLMSICPIYHSAVRLGLDAEGLFSEVAALSAPEMADLLRGWLRRQPENQSLGAFGQRETLVPEGARIEVIPLAEYLQATRRQDRRTDGEPR